MDKRSVCQTFGEEVTKLLFGVNLYQGDTLGRISNLVMEPMVLDDIVFGVGCHVVWF